LLDIGILLLDHGEGECRNQDISYHDTSVVIPIVTSEMSKDANAL
jgi:hypothetical protein